MQQSIVKKSASISDLDAMGTINVIRVEPKPVRETTPEIIPAIAHAITTPSELLVPLTKPSPSFLAFMGTFFSIAVKVEVTAATLAAVLGFLERITLSSDLSVEIAIVNAAATASATNKPRAVDWVDKVLSKIKNNPIGKAANTKLNTAIMIFCLFLDVKSSIKSSSIKLTQIAVKIAKHADIAGV